MTGRLPQMVRKSVDVGLLCEWRGDDGGGTAEGINDPMERVECGMVGALQGWKAAVDALDQSHRYKHGVI